VVAVYQAAVEAVHRARQGAGPTLLECRTYRWRGHVGPSMDMDVGVRRKDELKDWLPSDPVARARKQLVEMGKTQVEMEKIEHEVTAEVNHAIEFARKSPYPAAGELHEHLFVDSPNGN